MIPRTLKIGSQTYKVRLGTDRSLGENLADVDTDKTTIRLRRSLSSSRRVECLIHECIHAMLVGIAIEGEEEIVMILGEGVAQLIRDNPRLISYIKEATKA